jgi:TatD DNase family protein
MIDLERFGGSLQKVIDEANQKNVTRLLTVSVDLADHAELVKIADSYPNIYISAGTHPNEHPHDTIDRTILESAAQHPKVIAIGETGLDYYRQHGDLSWQKERFVQHIGVAKDVHKPLIIHTRMAKEETLSLLREEGARDVGGVMHCFTEDWEMAKQALDLGFYISFSGIVTFKNAVELQEVAKKVPLSRMLVETDSPYLAPIPHRGKPNCPAYVYYVAEFIASLRNVSIETIAKETTDNFLTLFKI